jgi:hypothetical protein
MIYLSDESHQAKPCVLETFQTYRWSAALSTEAPHSFHTGISTAKWSRMFKMRSRIGTQPGGKTAEGEPLERKQQHATFARNENCRNIGTRRGESLKICQKTNLEVLANEPFGNSIPEYALRGRSCFKDICPYLDLMPDERRELHNNAQRATHLLST